MTRYFGPSHVLVVLQVDGRAQRACTEVPPPQLACFPNGVVDEPICGEDLMAVASCCAHPVVMTANRSAEPLIDRGPRLEAGSITGHVLAGDLHAAEPQNGGRPGEPDFTFGSVLCGVDRSSNARAARDQAELLASPAGTVEFVPARQVTRHGPRALRDRCEGHDLLALGAGAAARIAVEHAPIPILVARWGAFDTKVTDTILVPVEDSPESSRAVELAGRLAAVHGGTVTILVAPPRDPVLQRAIAASARVLLGATGKAPRLLSEQLSRERAIPSAAVTLSATLVVVGSAGDDTARRMTAQIAGCLACSVLAVPAPGPNRARGTLSARRSLCR
jgi:nucleotide-binding universal stress UspA family protein